MSTPRTRREENAAANSPYGQLCLTTGCRRPATVRFTTPHAVHYGYACDEHAPTAAVDAPVTVYFGEITVGSYDVRGIGRTAKECTETVRIEAAGLLEQYGEQLRADWIEYYGFHAEPMTTGKGVTR